MDFIEGLPNSQGRTIIWVIVDRLSKYGHFISLHHPYIATSLAQVFMNFFFRLHGLSKTIVSDKDTVFTIRNLSKMFFSEKPKKWSSWLYLAEWCYNTSHHSAINMSPYQAIYGNLPPNLSSNVRPKTEEGDIKDWAYEREKVIHTLTIQLLLS